MSLVYYFLGLSVLLCHCFAGKELYKSIIKLKVAEF